MSGGPADSIEFGVHVRPGGRRDAVEGSHDGVLAVRVSAPPTDGRANDAVVALLAAAFGVKRGEVAIIGGHTARRKRVRVDGVPAVLRARLAELLAPTD
jgi:uncharacterized protein